VRASVVVQMKAAEGEFGSPVLPMSLLDSLVHDAAIKYWPFGHYRIAVGEAAANVDRYTQRRLERFDISGTKLMQAAFSGDPPQVGKPPGNQASEVGSGPGCRWSKSGSCWPGRAWSWRSGRCIGSRPSGAGPGEKVTTPVDGGPPGGSCRLTSVTLG
jgi:hypothetical protein